MGKIKVKVSIYDRTAVLELMENFFHDCGENGVSDFKTWCEDNVTKSQESIVENIKDEVNRIAYELYEQEERQNGNFKDDKNKHGSDSDSRKRRT